MPIKRLRAPANITAELLERKRWLQARGRKFKLRPPPLLHPKGLEREYYRDLSKRFTKLHELVKLEFAQRLPSLLSQAAQELGPQRFDAFPDELETILGGILIEFGRELTDSEIQSLAKLRGMQVAEFNRAQNDKVFKAVLGVDVFRSEPYISPILETYAQANANLIKTLSQRHITDVRSIAMQAVRQGLPANTVREMIAGKVGKTNANLQLIARDQVSKLNGQLTRVRQTELGVRRYFWRTSLDERVRASHRVKEGRIFRWDQPPADTGHPGEDYQCRCYAEPVLEDLLPPELGTDEEQVGSCAAGLAAAAAVGIGLATFLG